MKVLNIFFEEKTFFFNNEVLELTSGLRELPLQGGERIDLSHFGGRGVFYFVLKPQRLIFALPLTAVALAKAIIFRELDDKSFES